MIIAVQTRAAAVIPAEQPHEAGVSVPGPVVEVPAEPAPRRSRKRKGDAGAGDLPAAVDADPPAEEAS